MAGYKRERRIYILEFTDPQYQGLEVKVRSIPIREWKHLMTLDSESDDTETRVSSIQQMMYSFSEALVSWNMEDDQGNPLPTTLEYLESEDADFVMSLIMQWMKAIAWVDDSSPLDSDSQPGQPTPEVQNQPS